MGIPSFCQYFLVVLSTSLFLLPIRIDIALCTVARGGGAPTYRTLPETHGARGRPESQDVPSHYRSLRLVLGAALLGYSPPASDLGILTGLRGTGK